MRCDKKSVLLVNVPIMFQSTHLHEVRPLGTSRFPTRLKFQSTHLHEVRRFYYVILFIIVMFQSTHLHEVRRFLVHFNCR